MGGTCVGEGNRCHLDAHRLQSSRIAPSNGSTIVSSHPEQPPQAVRYTLDQLAGGAGQLTALLDQRPPGAEQVGLVGGGPALVDPQVDAEGHGGCRLAPRPGASPD